jgi:predicted ester cyclase
MRCLVTLALLLVAGSVSAQGQAARALTANQRLISQYAELGVKGQHEEQMKFWAPDAVNNGRPMRPEMIRVILEDIYRTFPDYRSEVLESVAIDDLVITLSRVSGTHKGIAQTSFNGGLLQSAKPTGRRFEVLQTHWWRLRQGKIVWHQGVRDDLRMLQQLGLLGDSLDPTLKVAPGP